MLWHRKYACSVTGSYTLKAIATWYDLNAVTTSITSYDKLKVILMTCMANRTNLQAAIKPKYQYQ